jgi:hypothetical protein
VAGWVLLFSSGMSLPCTVVRELLSRNEHLNVMACAILFLNVIVSGWDPRVTRIIAFCHTTVAPPAAAAPCAPASSALDRSNATIFALISVLLCSQPLEDCSLRAVLVSMLREADC